MFEVRYNGFAKQYKGKNLTNVLGKPRKNQAFKENRRRNMKSGK